MCGEMARPIGMFDSGFGGLTVARAVIDLLPSEHLVYIGDTGRYPYGPRPQAEVREFARQLAWSLVKQHDVKAVVVACNTASAAALDVLQQELPVLVVDVVEPGARALVKASRLGTRRRDRHRGRDRLGCVRACGRVDRRGRRTDRRGVPRLRRVRRAWPDIGRRGHDPGRAAAGAGRRPRMSMRCCSAARTIRTSRV